MELNWRVKTMPPPFWSPLKGRHPQYLMKWIGLPIIISIKISTTCPIKGNVTWSEGVYCFALFIFRCGLSSCSPAYKCKWENTANQRRTLKLLHWLLILRPLRVHSTPSWFSHVSRWSWVGQGRGHEILWTFPHSYFIF